MAGISRNQRKALVGRGVDSLAGLAEAPFPVTPKIERIGDAALLRIREQARLQAQGRQEGRLIYELLDDVEDGNGLAALPPPSPADIFLDSNPTPTCWTQGLEYLTGMVTVPTDNQAASQRMKPLWSSTRSEERAGI